MPAGSEVSLTDLLNVSKNETKNNSLTLNICNLIRKDRGFSLVNSDASGEIPSPVGESETFKELIDFKNSSANSSLRSGKIKKIEFSDE